MIRPCFLIVDRESASAISTRKLIVETAKFNVITAYTGQEAIDTLRRYPALSGVVADSGVEDLVCDDMIAGLKALRPDIPVILIRTPMGPSSNRADYYLDSFDPKLVLALLQKLHPEESREIEKRNEELARSPGNYN